MFLSRVLNSFNLLIGKSGGDDSWATSSPILLAFFPPCMSQTSIFWRAIKKFSNFPQNKFGPGSTPLSPRGGFTSRDICLKNLLHVIFFPRGRFTFRVQPISSYPWHLLIYNCSFTEAHLSFFSAAVHSPSPCWETATSRRELLKIFCRQPEPT